MPGLSTTKLKDAQKKALEKMGIEIPEKESGRFRIKFANMAEKNKFDELEKQYRLGLTSGSNKIYGATAGSDLSQTKKAAEELGIKYETLPSGNVRVFFDSLEQQEEFSNYFQERSEFEDVPGSNVGVRKNSALAKMLKSAPELATKTAEKQLNAAVKKARANVVKTSAAGASTKLLDEVEKVMLESATKSGEILDQNTAVTLAVNNLKFDQAQHNMTIEEASQKQKQIGELAQRQRQLETEQFQEKYNMRLEKTKGMAPVERARAMLRYEGFDYGTVQFTDQELMELARTPPEERGAIINQAGSRTHRTEQRRIGSIEATQTEEASASSVSEDPVPEGPVYGPASAESKKKTFTPTDFYSPLLKKGQQLGSGISYQNDILRLKADNNIRRSALLTGN